MKAKLVAYLTDQYTTLDTIREQHKTDPVMALGRMTYYKPGMEEMGWIPVGTAEVTVSLVSQEGFVNSKIDTLQKQRQRVMAETQLKVNEIDQQIQELLCLEGKS